MAAIVPSKGTAPQGSLREPLQALTSLYPQASLSSSSPSAGQADLHEGRFCPGGTTRLSSLQLPGLMPALAGQPQLVAMLEPAPERQSWPCCPSALAGKRK